jgi:hypothetical protein
MEVPQRDIDLLKTLRSDARAMDLLRAKARWEGVSLYGVLAGWGDPRQWPDYRLSN